MSVTEFVQVITSVSALVAAAASLRGAFRIEAVHRETNSMKDALVEATGLAAHAAGVAEGRKEQQESTPK